MGYEDREYMQRGRGGDNASILPGYPACRFIIVATIAVFLAQIFLTRPVKMSDVERMENRFRFEIAEQSDIELDPMALNDDIGFHSMPHFMPGKISVVQDWFELDTDRVMVGQVWRLVTSAFVHDRYGVWHIFVNLLMLYWFGRELEDMYGSREFLTFYFAAAILASLCFVGLQLFLQERIPAIGASGAVMAVVCLYAIHYPYDEVNVMFLIPVQMRFLLLFYVVFDLHPILLKLAGTPMFTGTAHAAHLGGLAFGYLYWKFDWTLSPFVDQFQSKVRRKKPRTNSEDGPQTIPFKPRHSYAKRTTSRAKKLEAELDTILEKISEQGEDALTDRERRVLSQASDHFKNQN